MTKKKIAVLSGVLAVICAFSVMLVVTQGRKDIDGVSDSDGKSIEEKVEKKTEGGFKLDANLAVEMEKLRSLEKLAKQKKVTEEIRRANAQLKQSGRAYAQALSDNDEIAQLRKEIAELKSTIRSHVSIMSEYSQEIARHKKENINEMSRRIREVVQKQQAEMEELFENGTLPESNQKQAEKITAKYSGELAKLRGFITEPPVKKQRIIARLEENFKETSTHIADSRDKLRELYEKLAGLEKELRVADGPVNAAAGNQYRATLALKRSLRSDPDVARQRELVERLKADKIANLAENRNDNDNDKALLLEQREGLPEKTKQKVLSKDEALVRLKEIEEGKDT